MTADEVLISSSKCGQLMQRPSFKAQITQIQPYSSSLTSASAAYAQQCYGNTTAQQECSIYIKRSIPQAVIKNASCPFPGKDKICVRNSTNLRLGSGLINSHDHFGINSAPKDRFDYRVVLECGPLRTEEYTQTFPEPGNTSDVRLSYGAPLFENGSASDSVSFHWPLAVSEVLQDYQI